MTWCVGLVVLVLCGGSLATRGRPSSYRVVDDYDCRVAENLKRDIAEAKGITWRSREHEEKACIYQNETMAGQYINTIMREYRNQLVSGSRSKRAAAFNPELLRDLLWDKKVIPWQAHRDLSNDVVDTIREAVSFWEENTCLEFPEAESYDGDRGVENQHILFSYGTGCLTFVGRSSNSPPQNVFINNACDSLPGEISHLLAQVMGLWFEHIRPERVDHLDVIDDNVQTSEYPSFDLISNLDRIEDFDTPYDLDSITHHHAMKFSRNGQVTLQPHVDDHLTTIGQRARPSFYDVLVLNRLHGCLDICGTSGRRCFNEGYPNPNDCSSCICPEGLGGDCRQPARSVGIEDWGGDLDAELDAQVFTSPGLEDMGYYRSPVSVHWMITAPRNSRIALWFRGRFGVYKKGSVCQHWIEFRSTPGDYSMLGTRMCGTEMPRFTSSSPYITSDNEVLVNFVALTDEGTEQERNGFQVEYEIAREACAYNPCQNGGECFPDERDLTDTMYTCDCTAGWSGVHCEAQESCDINPDVCANDGVCIIVSDDTYECRCTEGWSGPFCTVDEGCDDDLCENGVCVETSDGYRCECSPGWTGRYCDTTLDTFCVDVNDFCENGGECYLGFQNRVRVPLCRCSVYWTGDRCEDDVDECSQMRERCRNDGQCVNIHGGFVCDCREGWTGEFCDTSTIDTTTLPPLSTRRTYPTERPTSDPNDGCDWGICWRERPCMNGGWCMFQFQRPYYQCHCVRGYSGRNCETPPDSSCEPNPCQNGGCCQHWRFSGGYRCQCLQGFMGTHCEIESPCNDNPCDNGGYCLQHHREPYYRCQCVNDFTGDNCQTPGACSSQPCENGGSCFGTRSGGFNCVCRRGFTGENCQYEDPCASRPCDNGGTCLNEGDGEFSCQCRLGFTGRLCEDFDDSVVPIIDGCGACGVSLGTTAPTCESDEPTRCRNCMSVRGYDNVYRCTTEICYEVCCSERTPSGQRYEMMQLRNGERACALTGCGSWGSCGRDNLKYRTCHTVDIRVDDNGNSYQEIRRYEDCRICHSTLPYEWIGRDDEPLRVEGDSRDYSADSSDSWESRESRESRDSRGGRGNRGNRGHRRTGGGRK